MKSTRGPRAGGGGGGKRCGGTGGRGLGGGGVTVASIDSVSELPAASIAVSRLFPGWDATIMRMPGARMPCLISATSSFKREDDERYFDAVLTTREANSAASNSTESRLAPLAGRLGRRACRRAEGPRIASKYKTTHN